MVVKKNGDILVTDNLCNYLDVLDFQGHSVRKIWPADLLHLPRENVRPRSMAIDNDDNVYVSVSGDANEILVLSPDYQVKAVVNKLTSTSAHRAVSGLWVDQDGKIYVTYAQGIGVQIFLPDGTLQNGFGQHDSGPQNFSLPSGVITDVQHNIWVVDTLRHVVSIFKQDHDGNATLIDMIGGNGNGVGQFIYPSAIAGDGATYIFVLENTGARLQAFQIQLPDSAS